MPLERSNRSTLTPVWIVAPNSRISTAIARATAAKSTIPVSGENNAAAPTACGSISAISSPRSRRRPGTPFATPRRSSSSSLPSSA